MVGRGGASSLWHRALKYDARCNLGRVVVIGPSMRRPLDIAEDIVGVGEFKTHASAYLRRVKQTRGPVIITQNGRATAVVVSAERYLELENREWVRDQIREGIESLHAAEE